MIRPHIGTHITRIWNALKKILTADELLPRWVLWVATFMAPILVLMAFPIGRIPTTIGAFALPLVALIGRWFWNWRRGKTIENDPSRYRKDAFPGLNGIVVWRWTWKGGIADPGDNSDLTKRIIDLRAFLSSLRPTVEL